MLKKHTHVHTCARACAITVTRVFFSKSDRSINPIACLFFCRKLAPRRRDMKLVPTIQLPQLPPVSAAGGITGMDSRLPSNIPLPFSTDFLWRASQYGPPINFPHATHPPPSSLLDFKTHLPANLGKCYHRLTALS